MCLRESPAPFGSAAHAVEHLCGDYYFVPFREVAQSPARHLLACARRVHVRGIEEVDALLQRPLVERACLLLVQDPVPPFRRAIRHRPQADARNLQPRLSQTHILHERPPDLLKTYSPSAGGSNRVSGVSPSRRASPAPPGEWRSARAAPLPRGVSPAREAARANAPPIPRFRC